ncbi:hypothetical protein RE428_22140 [Marinobacter nanhaiticus D15-8W]|uniref:Uncharacterized protein n=1 Tax=Marinobacter nanhaiticus D15-8W TaxID=626887 RepID=N6WS20_9GAMM|nr:hypothetical protein [Marinobacter nanhaiticus]ENO13822.1 hypothetical protein J057_20540 [Marinobacter nanhaiticus D15-8W]BES71196.1 hypothetical protein RE428_22140 [Marinobacter nanhaiticus D15-8W]
MVPALVIFLALAFIVGSIFWLKPSPDERRRMRLRNHAIREEGFKVQTLRGELKDRFRLEGDGVEEEELYLYWKPWGEQSGADRNALIEPRILESGAVNPAVPGAEQLPPLSGAFRGWLADSRGIGFVWDESAPISDMDKPMAIAKNLA